MTQPITNAQVQELFNNNQAQIIQAIASVLSQATNPPQYPPTRPAPLSQPGAFGSYGRDQRGYPLSVTAPQYAVPRWTSSWRLQDMTWVNAQTVVTRFDGIDHHIPVESQQDLGSGYSLIQFAHLIALANVSWKGERRLISLLTGIRQLPPVSVVTEVPFAAIMIMDVVPAPAEDEAMDEPATPEFDEPVKCNCQHDTAGHLPLGMNPKDVPRSR